MDEANWFFFLKSPYQVFVSVTEGEPNNSMKRSNTIETN